MERTGRKLAGEPSPEALIKAKDDHIIACERRIAELERDNRNLHNTCNTLRENTVELEAENERLVERLQDNFDEHCAAWTRRAEQAEAALAERNRTIEVLTRAVNGLAERTPECKHQWVIYSGTAPYQTCSRCGKYETFPVVT